VGRTPPGQGGNRTAGSESCVEQGQPWLRSVDSERAADVIEPRKRKCWEPAPSGRWSATLRGGTSSLQKPSPAGVKARGRSRKRAPRELGRSRRLQPQGWNGGSEGNEANPGRREVGASNRTAEAGEPTQGTRWRESDAGKRNRSEDRWERHRAHKLSQRKSNG